MADEDDEDDADDRSKIISSVDVVLFPSTDEVRHGGSFIVIVSLFRKSVVFIKAYIS